jgi:beta-glucosidase
VVNIMRHWAWGRNDETYGECPVLSSAFAGAFVTGLQGDDPRWVAATAGCKHLVVHGGPDQLRQTFDANVTLRDWATTFMPAFEACVESGGLGMMCS